MSASSYRSAYFNEPLDEASAARCEFGARRYTEDIMAVVFDSSTPIVLLAEILHQMSHVLVFEMAATRNASSDLGVEYNEANLIVAELEKESRAVEELSMREARAMAEKMGMGPEMAPVFVDCDMMGTYRDVLRRSSGLQTLTPPSGRATPLLRISSEAIGIPERPHTIVHQWPHAERDKRGLLLTNRPPSSGGFDDSKNFVPPKSPEVERAEYRKELRRQLGSLRHRVHTFRQMQRVCDINELKTITRVDIQLAVLYCVYTSRSVRRLVCMVHNDMRAPEWAPLHESKVSAFMGGLNILTERYNLGEINAMTYLYLMRHLHAFNFVLVLTDAEVSNATQVNI
jgi:hypothetical protein